VERLPQEEAGEVARRAFVYARARSDQPELQKLAHVPVVPPSGTTQRPLHSDEFAFAHPEVAAFFVWHVPVVEAGGRSQ
jgi:hypothetical protein